MKKIISVFLVAAMLLMNVAVNAENIEVATSEAEHPEMSIEIVDSNVTGAEGIETENEDDLAELATDVFSETNGYETYSLERTIADSWTKVTGLNTGMAGAELVVVNDELYIVGGMSSSGFSYSIQKHLSESDTWQDMDEFDTKVKGYSTVVIGNEIYIIGGYADGTYQNIIQIYDTTTDEWRYMTPMLNRRDGAAALYLDNKLYVFGGRNATGIVWSYEYYDFEEEKWNLVTTEYDDSLVRIGAKVKYVDNSVYLYGGYGWGDVQFGLDVYNSQNMEEKNTLIYPSCDGVECDNIDCPHICYDDISIVWGENRGIVILNDSSINAATIEEIISEDGVPTLNSIAFTDNESKGKYSSYAIYDGYLYCIGGWNATSKSYMKDVYKYSVYYGDYSESDGTISSTVTENGNRITMNVENGREYMLFVNGPASDEYIYTIEYPEDTFTVVDTCAMTVEENGIGNINGTDIVVLESDNNGVSFKTIEMPPESGVLTKTVNAVILKATSPGQRTITYAMTIDEEASE